MGSNVKSFQRMNSKISMISKKRAGIKTKVDEFSNRMAGVELNVQKLLEDVWNMKTREKNNIALIKKLQETVDSYQLTYDKCLNEQEEINKKIEEMKVHFDTGMKLANDFNTNTEILHSSISKQINTFSKEYQDGFKRIIKLEINSNHHKNMLVIQLINTLGFIRENSKRAEKLIINSEDHIIHTKIDLKGIVELRNEMKKSFDSLYQQLQDMTADQAKFNFETNEDLNRLDLLIKEEVDIVKRENELVLREIRRAERNISDYRQFHSTSQTVEKHFTSKAGFTLEDCRSDNEPHNFSNIDQLKIKTSVFSPFIKSRATNLTHKNCFSDDGRSKDQCNSKARNRNAFSSVKQNRDVKNLNKTVDNRRPETTKFTKLKRFKFFGKNRDHDDQTVIRFKFQLKNDSSLLQ